MNTLTNSISLIITLLLSGCMTTDYEFPNTSSESLKRDKMLQSLRKEVVKKYSFSEPEKRNILSNSIYANLFDFDTTFINTRDGQRVVFTAKIAKGFYASGKYDHRSVISHSNVNSPSELFTDIVTASINDLKKTISLKYSNADIQVDAYFYGGADALRIRYNTIRYNSIYGQSISVSAQQSKLNGQPHAFQIKLDDYINKNSELAFLRAYGMYYLFDKKYQGIFNPHFEVTVSGNTSNADRFARIEATISLK